MINFLLTQTPLVFLTQSFWRDEAFSFLMAQQGIWQILINTAKDFSPPLYYLFLHFWMMIFGSSEIALRSVSLIFFYATIYVVDHFLIDVLKIKTKWRYAYLLLFAINPFLIYYASETRMYSMSVFLVTASWYGYLTGKKKLHIVMSVLSLYTHYFTALALVSQFLFHYLQKKHKSDVSAFVWIAVLFAPWVVFTLIFHGSTDGSFWITEPTLKTFWLTPGIILTGFENSVKQYSTPLYGLTFIAYGAIVMALKNFINKNDKRETSTYLLLWAFLPAVLALTASLIKPVFLARYIIFSVTGISLLIIYSLHQLKPPVRLGVYVLIVILMLQYNGAQIANKKKGDIRSLIRQINLSISPNDSVYVENELDFHAAQYYFGPNRVFIYRKTYDEIPQFVGKVLIPRSRVVSTLPLYPRKAFVIHSDLSYDVQSMN